jgi:uncharacterized OB-fold protein
MVYTPPGMKQCPFCGTLYYPTLTEPRCPHCAKKHKIADEIVDAVWAYLKKMIVARRMLEPWQH